MSVRTIGLLYKMQLPVRWKHRLVDLVGWSEPNYTMSTKD